MVVRIKMISKNKFKLNINRKTQNGMINYNSGLPNWRFGVFSQKIKINLKKYQIKMFKNRFKRKEKCKWNFKRFYIILESQLIKKFMIQLMIAVKKLKNKKDLIYHFCKVF